MLAVFLWLPAFLVYSSKESGERFPVTHIVAVFICWRGGCAKAEGAAEGGWEEDPPRQQTCLKALEWRRGLAWGCSRAPPSGSHLISSCGAQATETTSPFALEPEAQGQGVGWVVAAEAVTGPLPAAAGISWPVGGREFSLGVHTCLMCKSFPFHKDVVT